MIFRESDIEFNFNKDWSVRKYDAHYFYKGLSGAGLSAVDFIGLLYGNELVLFEIKNFRQGRKYGETDFESRMKEELPVFMKKMKVKVVDSLRGIDAIGRYFQRKPLYRLFLGLIRKLNFHQYKWVFWTKVYDCSTPPLNCTFILWLETDKPLPELRKKIKKTLKTTLKGKVNKVLVVDSHSNPFPDSLKAKLLMNLI